MNLVVNARDAMPKGGSIAIGIQPMNLAQIDTLANSERRPGGYVCLSVADTGLGMDESTLKHIFEPFFTTKEAGKGTGLGLATVHGIVAQHQGWVEVESVVGHGTTFRVYLPADGKSSLTTASKVNLEPAARGSETILLVEDEIGLRKALAQSLRALGYCVHEAVNGQAAMTLWQRHGAEVDLLLTDMVLPEGITGLELGEKLMTLKPGLRMIISSGYSAEVVRAGMPAKPGVVYLPKPFDTNTLADVVRRCLERPPCEKPGTNKQGDRRDPLPHLLTDLGDAPVMATPPPPKTAAEAPCKPLTREAMSVLPPELKQQLGAAALRGRYHELIHLIDQAAAVDSALSTQLRQLVVRYDYETLIQLMN